MNLLLLLALALGQSRESLDLEFAAAVEASIAPHRAIPEPYDSLIERLDSDRYSERAAAGKALQTKDAERWLIRARVSERRPEVRYWLNRILRAVNRCEACDGLGYRAKYDPLITGLGIVQGEPCQRCGRNEWQHGSQYIADGVYGYLACPGCDGAGTYWRHWAVD